MDLNEIKQWREKSTMEDASFTFISRVDRLIEIAESAENVRISWQKYCDECGQFGETTATKKSGFEDHRALYELAEVLLK